MVEINAPQKPTGALRRRSIDLAQFFALTLGVLFIVVEGAQSIGYNWQWYRVPQYLYRVIDGELIWGPLLNGLKVTIEISAVALALSIIVGLIVAMMRLTGSRTTEIIARVYLEVVRNTPLLIQIYLFYFVLSPLLGIDRYWTAVIALCLFEGAYISEIIRAGVISVPKGQWEAGASLGLSMSALYRRVVLPQALRLVLPPATSQAISLVKASSIVSVIAVFDLTTEGRNIIADTFMTFEIWITVAAIYLAINLLLSLVVSLLEHRLTIAYR
jgi:polar amino acid transport system permease protein